MGVVKEREIKKIISNIPQRCMGHKVFSALFFLMSLWDIFLLLLK